MVDHLLLLTCKSLEIQFGLTRPNGRPLHKVGWKSGGNLEDICLNHEHLWDTLRVQHMIWLQLCRHLKLEANLKTVTIFREVWASPYKPSEWAARIFLTHASFHPASRLSEVKIIIFEYSKKLGQHALIQRTFFKSWRDDLGTSMDSVTGGLDIFQDGRNMGLRSGDSQLEARHFRRPTCFCF